MAYENYFEFQRPTSTYELDFNRYRYAIMNPNPVSVNVSINGYAIYFPANNSQNNGFRLINKGEYGTKDGNNLFELASAGYKIYIQRELINTAPTQPGAFTQPTGDLEIGDARNISWGASSDAEGNLNRYELDVSINGGAYAAVNWSLISSSFNYIIPTANNLKFRVRAVDNEGLASDYRESPVYTVTKPKYYWSKYNVATSWSSPTASSLFNDNIYFNGRTKNAIWDSVNKKYIESGGFWGVESVLTGQEAWILGTGNAIRCVASSNGMSTSGISVTATNYPYVNSVPTEAGAKGTLIQSGLIATEGTYPINGVHTDGFWYERNSRVNQSIAPTGAFTAPIQGTIFKPSQSAAVTFTASTAQNISLYEVEYRYNNSGLWTTLGTYNTSLSRTFTPTTTKTLTNVQFRVRAKNTNNVYSDYVYSEIFEIQHNSIPILSLDTTDNRTIYESDVINITGTATDMDSGNIVNVKYQIDGGTTRAIMTQISAGLPIPFSKALTLKGGKLFDGTTDITGALAEGTAHSLKVWAEDDYGRSIEQTRIFYVVVNRAPIIVTEAIPVSIGQIDSDLITIRGTVTDADANNISLKYKIGSEAFIDVYSGAGGPFSFNVKLSQLQTGKNTITIQSMDTYGAISIRTLYVTKTGNTTPLKTAVSRYVLTPPNGTAKGVVLWINREVGDLAVNVEISMTSAGEAESFVPMTKTATAFIAAGIEEDQYEYEAPSAKDKILLKITTVRNSPTSDKGIKLLSGVLS